MEDNELLYSFKAFKAFQSKEGYPDYFILLGIDPNTPEEKILHVIDLLQKRLVRNRNTSLNEGQYKYWQAYIEAVDNAALALGETQRREMYKRQLENLQKNPMGIESGMKLPPEERKPRSVSPHQILRKPTQKYTHVSEPPLTKGILQRGQELAGTLYKKTVVSDEPFYLSYNFFSWFNGARDLWQAPPRIKKKYVERSEEDKKERKLLGLHGIMGIVEKNEKSEIIFRIYIEDFKPQHIRNNLSSSKEEFEELCIDTDRIFIPREKIKDRIKFKDTNFPEKLDMYFASIKELVRASFKEEGFLKEVLIHQGIKGLREFASINYVPISEGTKELFPHLQGEHIHNLVGDSVIVMSEEQLHTYINAQIAPLREGTPIWRRGKEG